ncbi:MAG TPA: RHS repeat-associated core domain-containing protein, partial [Thermoanaerobaculia bacterium]|nr:RHS repeat-associated core domain-containing protein [Thermoanaerobaculia bacterium]
SYRAGGVGGAGWPGSAAWNTTLGRHWAHTFSERIVQGTGVGHVWLLARDATFREFTDPGLDGTYETVSPSDEYRDLFKVSGGWELRSLDGTVQSFDNAGLWTQTVDRNGKAKVAQYTGGVLTRVALPDGRREDFGYDDITGKLETIVEVGIDGATSRTWTYTWEGNDLKRIDRPDGTVWEFFYSSDPALPGYLTRIDLLGSSPGVGRVETAWEYDSRGNVVKIWRGDPVSTGPNAVDLHELAFDTDLLPTRTTVTDAVDKIQYYYFDRDTVSRKPRLFAFDDGCPACGFKARSTYEYSDPVNPLLPTTVIDGNGNQTRHTYNADGQMLTRTEAFGATLSRQTRWEYHSTFRNFPTLIERPSTEGGAVKRKTLLAYDDDGNLLTRTEEGREAGSPFSLTTTMTYNAAGQVLTIDPPGNGAADVTSLTYDSTRGGLVPLTRTDPVVGTTVFSYDPLNRRTGVTDVNQAITVTAYDNLNRVTSVTEDGGAGPDLVTNHEYDVFGDLLRTTRPRGNVVEYGRDAMGRLTSIESKPNAATPGERTLYTLDKAGHRIQEDLQSWNGSAWETQASTQYVYSSKCNVDKVIRPGSVTEQEYTCNGEVARVWDANHPRASNPASRSYSYDALNRLTQVKQPDVLNGDVTAYVYDVQDHLTQVTDAEKNVTTYTYGDRDLLTQEISPVSGTRTYLYNDRGELIQETDARGVTVTRDYDDLDRVTAVNHPDPSLDVTYTYDAPGAFSKGRLTGITRHGETIVYEYDRFGRLTRDGDLTYGYDANGNRTSIGYPEDILAVYTYDYADRQQSLTLTVDEGPPLALASNATYKPFGPLTSLSLGNGLTETRTYDQRYQPATIQVAGSGTLLNWSYAVDGVGNITAITDLLNPANNRTFAYRDLYYFLTQGDGPWGPRAWTYDKIGNRLTETRGAATDTYSYPINAGGGRNPKLQLVTEGDGGARQYSYDEAGNTQQILDQDLDQRLDLIHDGAGRMSFMRFRAPESKLVAMTYDGRGFLSKAEEAGGGCFAQQTLATYSSEGVLHRREHRLLDGGGSIPVQGDTLFYFDGKPLVNLKQDSGGLELTLFSNDHLGSPVLATEDTGGSVWYGGFEPFGADHFAAKESGVFLRLPGQWEDGAWLFNEAPKIYYNLHRWYETSLGRYLSPDPRGAQGDTHPYLYAVANPPLFLDPSGEKSRACCTAIPALRIAKHCFIEVVDDQTSKSTTYSLHGMGGPRRYFGGPVGCRFTDDGFDVSRIGDRRTECGSWNDNCEADRCVEEQHQAYPSPSFYALTGPNSNTYAGHVATTCKLDPPKNVGLRTPGWGDPLPPPLFIPGMRGPLPLRCPLTR